jgi:hypothetical protein
MKSSWYLFFARGQAAVAKGNSVKALGHFGHHAQPNQ